MISLNPQYLDLGAMPQMAEADEEMEKQLEFWRRVRREASQVESEMEIEN